MSTQTGLDATELKSRILIDIMYQYASRRNPFNLYRQATLAKFIVFLVGIICCTHGYIDYMDFAGMKSGSHVDENGILFKKNQCDRALTGNNNTFKLLGVTMVDFSSKIMLVGTPKGGATLTAQLFLKRLGLMDKAIAYNPWIHHYRQEVFYKQKGHKRTSCDAVCGVPGWTCAKMVRSPLDRVVSSYIHTMKNKRLIDGFPQLEMAVQNSSFTNNGKATTQDASFADFVKALTIIRDNFQPSINLGWDHYIPQSMQNPSCDDNSNVYLIPMEEVEDALAAFANETGVVYNTTGLTSPHYESSKPKTHSKFDVHDTWDYAKMTAVPYDRYLTDPQLNLEICNIFCKDIFLYAKACSSIWLQSLQTVQAACRAERERVVSVCGEEYDFFVRK